MASWFGFWESNGTSQEITSPEINGTINPEINSHGIIIPETVLSQTKGIKRMMLEMT
jgi:glutamate mutase epsilon subunit